MGHLRTACDGIRICADFYQRIQTHVPEIISLIVSVEDELFAHIVAETGTECNAEEAKVAMLCLFTAVSHQLRLLSEAHILPLKKHHISCI